MRKANGKVATTAPKNPARRNGVSRTTANAARNGSSNGTAHAVSRTAGASSSRNGAAKTPAKRTALAPVAVRPVPAVRPVAPPPVIDPRFASFHGVLTERRRELTRSLEETKFDTIARLGRVAEEDQAQMSHEEFISLQRNSMDYQALRLVDGALERMESGEYGTCQECDEEISQKRLAAIPWAKYCVVCQDRARQIELDNERELSNAW